MFRCRNLELLSENGAEDQTTYRTCIEYLPEERHRQAERPLGEPSREPVRGESVVDEKKIKKAPLLHSAFTV